MRTTYHEQLSALTKHLGETCALAGLAMEGATQALLRADLDKAEQVIREREEILALNADATQQCVALLALQQPVAGELREIVSAIEMIADLDRMSALAAHVATIARRRHPRHVLPNDVEECFSEMGRQAVALANQARRALLLEDPEKAARLGKADDTMDNLYRQLLTVVIERQWTHGVPAAVDAALLGRFYERFADHAVAIGRRVIFGATGIRPADEAISPS
jgi:phosphate transport system protein